MKFTIDRVSGDTPPCEGAVSEKVTYTHTAHYSPCGLSSPMLRWLKENNPTFRREGDFYKWEVTLDGKWTIEINTLEELVALQEKIGDDLILKGNHLTIYDSYME